MQSASRTRICTRCEGHRGESPFRVFAASRLRWRYSLDHHSLARCTRPPSGTDSQRTAAQKCAPAASFPRLPAAGLRRQRRLHYSSWRVLRPLGRAVLLQLPFWVPASIDGAAMPTAQSVGIVASRHRPAGPCVETSRPRAWRVQFLPEHPRGGTVSSSACRAGLLSAFTFRGKYSSCIAGLQTHGADSATKTSEL